MYRVCVCVCDGENVPDSVCDVPFPSPLSLNPRSFPYLVFSRCSGSSVEAQLAASNGHNITNTNYNTSNRAVVLWDFDARSDEELTLKQDQIVTVIHQYGYEESDTDFWQVCCQRRGE